MTSLYPYCDSCTLPFVHEWQKIECGLYWRPLTGTKDGFPQNGQNCPKDTWNTLTDEQKEEIAQEWTKRAEQAQKPQKAPAADGRAAEPR